MPGAHAKLGLSLPDSGRALAPLVCVFLRGGADALNLVVPHFEDRYYALRPSLAVPRPDHADTESRCLPLDERFGLHPRLASWLPAFRSGELAIVHAIGSDDQTRSHFEAQDQMERGESASRALGSGWLARLLRAQGRAGSLSAVAMGTRLPESLRAAPAASVLASLADYALGNSVDAGFEAALGRLYGASRDDLGKAGRDALATLKRLRELDRTAPPRDSYPKHSFGRQLADVARLIKADVGVHAASVDLGGWDTHFGQQASFSDQVDQLGKGISAFRQDLGEHLERTTIVVMTEFGRRSYENTTFGTDHGRAGVMFVLGGEVRGGRVITEWPGLAPGDLESPGDLRVTIDYRDVLAELALARLPRTKLAKVFPDYTPKTRGVLRSDATSQ